MSPYIDGFIFPIPRIHLNTYRQVAEKVAEIWKEYGAIAYNEYVGDDLSLAGTKTFTDTIAAKKDEAIVFGWVTFPSKEVRDEANRKVPLDLRMSDIVAPITDPENPVFDAARMVYGGFQALVTAG